MSEQRKSRKKQVSAGRQFLCWSLCYTICFVLLALIIWQPFYREGRSFIWGYDGLYQTYTAMQYYSRYWKEFFSSVLAGHPSLPMVDSTVGLGFDVFTSLNHYGFGDPLQLVSLLFTEETMEVGYAFLTLLRFYLAGLAFGAYAMFVTERKRAILPLLAGAISYCFCGFALYAGVRHPYFMNSLIYLPLLLLGAERILQGKRGTLLTLMVAVAACSDFYFLYILTFLTFSYALVRYFCRYACVPRGMGEKRGKEEEKGERKGKEREEREGRGKRREKGERKGSNLGRVLGAGVGSYLLGLALGAFCLLPNVLAFFGNARSGISTSAISSIPDLSWLLYSKEFYLQLLRGFFFPEYSVQYWCILSFCPAVLLGFFCLFREKKQGRGQGEGFGVWFVLLTVWLLLPCCGYMLNGFSYVSHRWLYAYAFCLSWFLTLGIENMGERKPWELGAYFGLLAVAAGLAYLAGESRRELSGVLLLSLGMGFFLFLSGKDERWLPVGRFGMLLGTGLFCVFSANYLYTAEGLHYTAEFQEAGTALQTMTQVSEAQWKEEMEPDVFYRVEGDTISEANYGMLTGINGTNPFFSIVPETVYRFMHNLENPDSKFPNWYNGMGDRAALMSLASVRYFAMGTNCGSTQVLPFGYEKIAESESGSLYESPYALPLGYTYEAVISEEEMESLEGGIQRQQALMQAAELPKEAIEEIEKEGMEEMDFTILRGEELQLEEQRLDYEIVAMENLTWDRETKAFVVGEGGGSIKLHFEGEAGAETYVRMLNFDTDGSGQELIYYFVGDGESEKKIYLSSNLSVWDGKFKTSLTAVGNGEEVCDRAVIRVPFAGSYHLEEIEVYSLPMQSFCEQAEKLREESLDGNLVGNRVEGNISVSSDKILCLSLPYSGGWSAKVDGKDVSVWKCNGMFLAILVPEGSHRVEFSYRTPGLFWGMGISVLAFLWWIMCHTKYTFAYTKRKRIYE